MSHTQQVARVFESKASQSRSHATLRRTRWLPLAIVALSLFIAAGLSRTPLAFGGSAENDRDQVWVATWGASPVAPLPANTTNPGFTNQTVRLIVHTSVGGSEVRVRLSNAFGNDSLVVGAAHIALRSRDAGNGAGHRPGAHVQRLRVDHHSPGRARRQRQRQAERAGAIRPGGEPLPARPHRASHMAPRRPRDELRLTARRLHADAQMPVDHTVASWFYLTDVEVKATRDTLAIVTLGDSITDGTASTTDANHRWPNLLAERLAARHLKLTVVDQGIGGNRILHDLAGPNALARFDRDVLAQSGVGYVTVLLGINDIGRSGTGQPPQPVSADEIIAGHRQMVMRAHQLGLKIFGCTLTPYEGAAYFSAEGEAKREAVNKFIRTSGAYDGVIDFDAAVHDPSHPTRFLGTYDSGDHLHPNDAGYQAMANAIDLSLFRRGR